ncbi:hypothetical protein [Nitrosomonas sp. Nm166]|uniref:hypothetical protein n=1 Tax=Nitrosomonas sp. Nm166 TaxID=1881054 RepID=UPI000B8864F7|nr:hypothetical protein [Nitrosomonas sp. Nm166]
MDDQDIRRANLQDIVNKIGLSETAKRFKKPDRQINDMLKGRKSFGEEVAKDVEDNYAPGVPHDWLRIPEVFLNNGELDIERLKQTTVIY